MRRQLLPALPPGRPAAADDRHRHEPHRLPLHPPHADRTEEPRHDHAEDLLASWNDTPTETAIVDFVDAVTDATGADYVPPEERVAVFDNDGTLWAEKPMPIQLDFTLRRLAERPPPTTRRSATSSRGRPATSRTSAGSAQAMVKHYHGDDSDMRSADGRRPDAFAGLTVEQYSDEVAEFFRTADAPEAGPRLPRRAATGRWSSCCASSRPTTSSLYIASGGDRDFMRPVAGRALRHPTRADHRQRARHRLPRVRRRPRPALQGRDGLLRRRARRSRCGSGAGSAAVRSSPAGTPTATCPCSASPASDHRPSLRLLLLHDDAEREFDYTAGAEDALANAEAAGWTVISMKHDWSTVFGT